jgi:hypothetical protein
VGVGTVLPEDQRRRRAYLATAACKMDAGSSGAIASPPWMPYAYAVNMSGPSR